MARKEYTIVVLSSSPPVPDAYNSPHYAAPTRRVAMPPSSPFALSPLSNSRASTPTELPSSSRTAPVAEKTTKAFATVGSIVCSEHFAQQPDAAVADAQQIPSLGGSIKVTGERAVDVKKPRKRATKKVTVVDGENPKPKPRGRKPKADNEVNNHNISPDSELRLPRARCSRKSPSFESPEGQTAVETTTDPVPPHAPRLTKSGNPRKARAKKEKLEIGNTEVGPKPTKLRATKPKAGAKAGKVLRKPADITSAHFPVDKDNALKIITGEAGTAGKADTHDASIWDVPQSPRSRRKALKRRSPDSLAEGLDLEEAVSRRRNWTPTRDTVAQSPSVVSTGKENNKTLANGTLDGPFTNLLSNFAYESPSTKVSSDTAISAAVIPSITKRRRVELIDLPGVQTNSRASPEKSKAPKKKPRTITDLVTDQYATKKITAGAQTATSDFFSPQKSTTKVSLNNIAEPSTEVLLEKPLSKRSKSKDGSEVSTAKGKSRVRKASTRPPAKPKPVTEKLLSPASAVLRMSRQEVLFGTSSQLALEESPTTVRQIQRALIESEHDMGNEAHSLPKASLQWPRLRRVEGKRGLWRESTRDKDGGLLKNMENMYILEPDQTQDLPLLMDVAHEELGSPSEPADIDKVGPVAPIMISSDAPTPPKLKSQIHASNSVLPSIASSGVFKDIDDLDSGLPPSNQNAEAQNNFVDIDDFQSAPLAIAPKLPASILRPQAPVPAVTTATVSPEKSPGWSQRVKSAVSFVPASTLHPSRKPSSPQRLSSTPPKGSGRFVDIEEILDSEDEALEIFSSTPPRMGRLPNSPLLALAFDRGLPVATGSEAEKPRITPIFRILLSHLEWANIRPSICASITAHVRSIPPTSDPKQPSWHEKILMYDPIILEDFTAYLNNNTNLRTYKRATQKQIKAFNKELKMRGDAILDIEGDDQVLATEKELEVHMIRDWCQETSICCIHAKESRGRGSARKGLY